MGDEKKVAGESNMWRNPREHTANENASLPFSVTMNVLQRATTQDEILSRMSQPAGDSHPLSLAHLA